MSQPSVFGHHLAADAPVAPDVVASRAHDSFLALLSSHAGASRPAYAVEGTAWYDTDTDQWFLYDGTSDLEIAVNRGTPASASAPGQAGWVAWDADYYYICTATDTWKRVAVATW